MYFFKVNQVVDFFRAKKQTVSDSFKEVFNNE